MARANAHGDAKELAVGSKTYRITERRVECLNSQGRLLDSVDLSDVTGASWVETRFFGSIRRRLRLRRPGFKFNLEYKTTTQLPDSENRELADFLDGVKSVLAHLKRAQLERTVTVGVPAYFNWILTIVMGLSFVQSALIALDVSHRVSDAQNWLEPLFPLLPFVVGFIIMTQTAQWPRARPMPIEDLVASLNSAPDATLRSERESAPSSVGS